MGSDKQKALDVIERLPDDVSSSDIVETLLFVAQVEKGLRDVEEGRVLTREQLRKEMAQWRKSAGR